MIYIYTHTYLCIYTHTQIYDKASVVNFDTGAQGYMRVLHMTLETFLYVSRNCLKIENLPHSFPAEARGSRAGGQSTSRH